MIGLEVPAVGAHGNTIVRLATANRLPTLFPGDAARFKPMLAYGTSLIQGMSGMAVMVDRILKGEKPGEIPVERLMRHYLTIDLNVAREIGITIPADLLARADKVVSRSH